MTSPVLRLLDARLARDGAAPLITYYDDATGERTELSAVTLDNWVAKTANLLRDGLDVEPGHRVAVLLDPHWQAAAVLLGAWANGAVVTAALPAQVLVVPEQRMTDFDDNVDGDADAEHILGLSLHPLGGRLSQAPPSTTDYAAEVPVYADDFAPYEPVPATAPAMVVGDLRWNAAELVHTARELAARLGLVDGDRLLVDIGTGLDAGPVAWLLAPLAAGASVVLCANPDPDKLAHRAGTERVTVTLGLALDGVRAAGS